MKSAKGPGGVGGSVDHLQCSRVGSGSVSSLTRFDEGSTGSGSVDRFRLTPKFSWAAGTPSARSEDEEVTAVTVLSGGGTGVSSTVSMSTLPSGYVSRVLMKALRSLTYRPNHSCVPTQSRHTNPSKSS